MTAAPVQSGSPEDRQPEGASDDARTDGATVSVTSVLGVALSLVDYDAVMDKIARPRADQATVVAVCNVHSLMTARRDPSLRAALAAADIRTPDGVPLVWALRSYGNRDQKRVYGPEIMRLGLERLEGARHFLYGSTTQTLTQLTERLHDQYPHADIAGVFPPPFTHLDDDTLKDHAAMIRRSEATVVWIGLGMPKQELLMPRLARFLPGVTLVGVGAAFDMLAGSVRQAPPSVQRLGLEWLFRLVQEPRRLLGRYIVNNPLYLALWAAEWAHRRIRGERPAS